VLRSGFANPLDAFLCLWSGTEPTIEPTAAITHRWAPTRRIGSWLKKTLFNQSSAALFIQIQGLPGSVPARTQEYEKQAAADERCSLERLINCEKCGWLLDGR